ncbi:(d)CMP kinase [Kocuria tytonicola]|uniref:Cytidylate kinase n=1 Tax=Kocuria tytonicola TaxID=2055946 RepID=A0A3L9KXU9_9MICC|nr:(d)CMP kinase [Kocuria tytonicola]RLY91195.1 (d)CMP kinase [Kocuria tytonicola]
MNARDANARLVIAIDGPSGSGKSSVSKEVARRFGLAYLDTGAMYRAVTWWCLETGVDLHDADAVVGAAETVPLELGTDPDEERILVNGEDVRAAIRGDLVTDHVSQVSTTVPAREVLVRMQQDIIRDSGFRIVAEGRDITTVVAPDADVRILLTASEAARLARRGRQLGAAASSNLEAQVVGRDAKDSTVVNFTQAQDGVQLLDSSDLTMEQTVQGVIDLVIRATDSTDHGAGTAPDETGADAPEETRQA